MLTGGALTVNSSSSSVVLLPHLPTFPTLALQGQVNIFRPLSLLEQLSYH